MITYVTDFCHDNCNFRAHISQQVTTFFSTNLIIGNTYIDSHPLIDTWRKFFSPKFDTLWNQPIKKSNPFSLKVDEIHSHQKIFIVANDEQESISLLVHEDNLGICKSYVHMQMSKVSLKKKYLHSFTSCSYNHFHGA